ncbi:MAG: amino acid adenylation domain-containing protein [Chloroflexota bacterium]
MTEHEPFARDDIEQPIQRRFAEQVLRHRACLAIGDGSRRLTYGALDAWSGAIASRLADAGVRPGDRVALFGRQGAAAIASVLGALRAGATYVPLDPDEPDGRLRSVLDRIDPMAIVADVGHAGRAARLWSHRPTLLPGDSHAPADPPQPEVTADAPAYVYFTSGSTGEPKGVVDSHRNVLHNVMRYTNALRIQPDDRLTLLQAPAFSGAVSSTFAALLNGAALMPFRLDHGGVARLAEWMRTERITIYHSVPSVLRAALASGGGFPEVRIVRLEGDRADARDVRLVRDRFESGTVLANGLGTTETGLCSQFKVDSSSTVDDGILAVGYPLPDMEIAVVDEGGSPVAFGVAGEIAVTSAYLALGYLDREDLTAAAFRPCEGRPGVRTYRTGDLGRLRPDQRLEYLGRRDGQLKVRGHRVEPAEVEAALVRLPGVREAAARTVSGPSGDGRLVAYLVPESSLDLAAVDRQLETLLPPHMRPSTFITLRELPVGSNGKVDRVGLPVPVPGPTRSRDFLDDPLERRVAAIFEDVLGRAVGRDDDFFGAGGDSLDAVRVLAALDEEAGEGLPASLIARAPTPAALAAALRRRSAGASTGSLFVLRGGGNRPPLVLLHGHDGHALMYAVLSRRLTAARPIWAFELDPTADRNSDLSIETIAARHVDELRDALPDGPYLLGGFCYGGVVAFEMAHQLRDAGQEVSLLALLAVGPEDFPALISTRAMDRWRRSHRPAAAMGDALDRIGSLTTSQRQWYLADRIGAVGRRLRAVASTRDRARHGLSGAVHAASEAYRPDPFDGRVTLLLPDWSTRRYSNEPAADWARLAASVRVHAMPGSHKSMLREPVVSMVANTLTQELAGLDPG